MTEILDVDDAVPDSPSDLPGPEFPHDTWRPFQRDTVAAILEEYVAGRRAVLVDAPTGSGKSMIGEAVRRLLPLVIPEDELLLLGDRTGGMGKDGGVRAWYVATTKMLQDQLAAEFPHGVLLKGRANYLTQSGALNGLGYPTTGQSVINCSDCTVLMKADHGCAWCFDAKSCPYKIAVSEALEGDLAILNTAYFLAASGPVFQRQRPLTIVDEADALEQVLMGHVEVAMNPSTLAKYGITPPKRVTVEAATNDWEGWAKDAWSRVMGTDVKDLIDQPTLYAREQRRKEQLEQRLAGLQSRFDEWAYDGDDTSVLFRPVKVARHGQALVWGVEGRERQTSRISDRQLAMSATFLSTDVWAREVGLPEGTYATVRMPSTIPTENRLIVFKPVVSMTRKTKQDAYPILAAHVEDIVRAHEGERVLIHAVSYELAGYLHGYLTRVDGVFGERLVTTYTHSGGKDQALGEYLREEGAVMVAPSMERGVDLAGDRCRVQIIAKVPWMFMSRQVKMRKKLPGGDAWYSQAAMQKMVQAMGRAVRGPDDWAVTYILDEQAQRLLQDAALPRYIREAVRHRNPLKPECADTVLPGVP